MHDWAQTAPVRVSNSVFTVGNVALDMDELFILEYGLNFIPSKMLSMENQLKADLELTVNRYPELQMNFGLIRDSIVYNSDPFSPNMHRSQYKSLNNLKRRNDIVVKQADKGQGIVVMSKEVYEAKTYALLEDKESYEELSENPIWTTYDTIRDEIKDLIKTGNIPKEYVSRIRLRGRPKPPMFYILSKVHKKLCPGRPIVSGIGHSTEKPSKFPDFILKPLVQKSSEIIREKFHISFYHILDSKTRLISEIIELNKEIKEKSYDLKQIYFATTDIESLYTNIPIMKGAAKVAKFARENSSYLQIKLGQSALFTLLKMVLKNNVYGNGNSLRSSICKYICFNSRVEIFAKDRFESVEMV
ncbi:unnamed protein product [Didymodactylos carnosus]|uniref:Reverse transcriptase domain-containing protein n=1 Tax=Didymodactylos carnosus TaxID=1234261 RepID=A0A8S2X277_9BILA|nr:unnamed protein product [Didymodactylos carnosus]CAF3573006.1 unnamed protein product [Didymodactylos carnosus]CAF4472034.1 unnamed protein product [Didymodactylos carnosus]